MVVCVFQAIERDERTCYEFLLFNFSHPFLLPSAFFIHVNERG